jgi:hypothetical protein
MAALSKNKNLTDEQRRTKYPLEYALKDLAQKQKETGVLTKELQDSFYTNLLALSKAIISHKYGSNSRLDYETLPHEIATSVYMTIVVREKEVFSWTNLMKKVVFDLASNYFRKEVYGQAHIVDIDQLSEDDDLLDGSDGSKLVDRYEIASDIKSEDVIYFGQVVTICFENLSKLCFSVNNLRDHLLLKFALYEIVHKEKCPLFHIVDKQYHCRYNLYLIMLQLELSPILNNNYFRQALYV